MNIIYLSYDGMTDPLGRSQVLPYLGGLADSGHHITLVSFEKQKQYALNSPAVIAYCHVHRIDWQPMMYTKQPPVLSTIWDVLKMRKKVNALIRNFHFDAVHCRSYIAALMGLQLKKKHGINFIFDMRGFWADERVDGKLWDLKNPLYRYVYKYFKRKEKEFLIYADQIISLTHNAAMEMQSWHLTNATLPISVIPCCADMKLFDPEAVNVNDRNALQKKLGIGVNDFVISYIGSLGTWYMLDEMLDFFSTLLLQQPTAKFLFITNDPDTDLIAKSKEKKIDITALVVTQSSRENMPLHISLSHATIFFIRPTFSKKASSPVKQGEAMAMGLPIICNAGIGDTDEIVNEAKAGIVISSFNDRAYEECAKLMMTSDFSSSQIRSYALSALSLESGISKYLAVYERLNRL